MLREAEREEKYATTVEIIRQIALTGCRRSEMIALMWTEADTDASCLRLIDSKEGTSVRPIGLPVVTRACAERLIDDGVYGACATAASCAAYSSKTPNLRFRLAFGSKGRDLVVSFDA